MRKRLEEKDRQLSDAEKARLERFERTSEELGRQGYRMTELTVGIVKANVVAMIAAVPVFIVGMLLFFLVNSDREIKMLTPTGVIVSIVILLALVVVHELIHGLTWSLFTERRFKDIEFGFMKEFLTPYCTCTVPLARGPYLAGALMPLIILGIIPTAIAIATGSLLLLMLGLIMILSAGGDIMIAMKILGYRSASGEILFYDHPTKAGGVVFER